MLPDEDNQGLSEVLVHAHHVSEIKTALTSNSEIDLQLHLAGCSLSTESLRAQTYQAGRCHLQAVLRNSFATCKQIANASERKLLFLSLQ